VNKLHYFAKGINLLNCVLALTIAAAAYSVITPFLNMEVKTILPAVRRSATETTERSASPQLPSLAAYAVVSEQNLFHPERKMPAEKKAEVQKVVIPKPDLMLYGTLIADDMSIAYVEDRKAPLPAGGRGNRQMRLKKGDSINGYVLREIEPDRVVLAKGEEKLVVMLEDKDKKRGVTGAAATPASAAAAPATAGTTAGGPPVRPGVPAGYRSAGSSPATGMQAASPLTPTSPLSPAASQATTNPSDATVFPAALPSLPSPDAAEQTAATSSVANSSATPPQNAYVSPADAQTGPLPVRSGPAPIRRGASPLDLMRINKVPPYYNN
jgi:hypothetical protein